MTSDHGPTAALEDLLQNYGEGAFTRDEFFLHLATLIDPQNVDKLLSLLPEELLAPLRRWVSQRIAHTPLTGLAQGRLLGAELSSRGAQELEKRLQVTIPLLERSLAMRPNVPGPAPKESHTAAQDDPAPLRLALYELTQAAVKLHSDIPLARNKVPFFDQSYDNHFTDLPQFAAAVSALTSVSLFTRRYGVEGATRTALEFLYRYLDAFLAHTRAKHGDPFDEAWAAFWPEIHESSWTYSGVCILQNFDASVPSIKVADGLWVLLRSKETSEGRLDDYVLEWLRDDWMRGSVGSYVLLAEHKALKTPENSGNYMDSFNPSLKLLRGLLALRLLHPGDVAPGRFHFFRSALFPRHLPGHSAAGFTVWKAGSEYKLPEGGLADLRGLYELVSAFEERFAKDWNNVEFAVRAFSNTYPQPGKFPEDQLLYALLGIDALMSLEDEQKSKVGSRVAAVLEEDRQRRSALETRLASFYSARSALVHGTGPTEKLSETLQNVGSLRNTFRLLLRGSLRLISAGYAANPRELIQAMDQALADERRATELRALMTR